MRLAGVREHERHILLSLEGVTDRSSAEAFIGATLYVAREAIPLAPQEYFDDDLVGCVVVGVRGEAYGVVERVEHYPSSDVLEVGGSLIPLVSPIVLEVSLAQKRIVIDPPEGLITPARPGR